MRLLPLARIAAMACRVRHREIGTATPPPYAIAATPPTRYAIDATHAFDAINVINKTQAADAAPKRRRQEADARAAQVRRLRVFQDAYAAVVG